MRIALVSLVALSTLSFVGCESSKSSFSMANLTPELMGLHERPAERYATWAVTDNAHLRMAADDMSRVFFTNQSSRLSPFPVVSFSGNPF